MRTRTRSSANASLPREQMLDITADSLDHMHDEVPGSYHELGDELRSMSSLFLSGNRLLLRAGGRQ